MTFTQFIFFFLNALSLLPPKPLWVKVSLDLESTNLFMSLISVALALILISFPASHRKSSLDVPKLWPSTHLTEHSLSSVPQSPFLLEVPLFSQPAELRLREAALTAPLPAFLMCHELPGPQQPPSQHPWRSSPSASVLTSPRAQEGSNLSGTGSREILLPRTTIVYSPAQQSSVVPFVYGDESSKSPGISQSSPSLTSSSYQTCLVTHNSANCTPSG